MEGLIRAHNRIPQDSMQPAMRGCAASGDHRRGLNGSQALGHNKHLRIGQRRVQRVEQAYMVAVVVRQRDAPNDSPTLSRSFQDRPRAAWKSCVDQGEASLPKRASRPARCPR